MEKSKETIVFIGAGNLATNLSISLKNAGYNILQIYSRSKESANQLADKLKASVTTKFEGILNSADIYVIALSDDLIIDVLDKVKFGDQLVVHAAGSVHIDIFKKKVNNYGVLYPLQTFSKSRIIEFDHIPIFIEANNNKALETIRRVSEHISKRVYEIDSKKRETLHLAAVFACNFSNHMYAIAEEILEKDGIPFDMLKPLIAETSNKIMYELPKIAQTGPAIRNNENIIKKHLDLLSYNPQMNAIYKILSSSIYQLSGKK